eukprot:14898803-Alexandrium_andersonii.AAC.1
MGLGADAAAGGLRRRKAQRARFASTRSSARNLRRTERRARLEGRAAVSPIDSMGLYAVEVQGMAKTGANVLRRRVASTCFGNYPGKASRAATF